MNGKAQASLEYLMTYGWALILIATVIGVLVFIVSSPSSSTVFNSSDPTKIMLRAGSVSGSSATIVLQNITGGAIEITDVGVGCNLVEGLTPIRIHGGGQFTLTCTVSNGSIGNISVQYTDYAGLDRAVDITSSGGGTGPTGPTDYVAYYAFSEGSGATAFDSAGENNGTLENLDLCAPPLDCNPNSGWVSTGISGNALSFDGVNDYVRLPVAVGTGLEGASGVSISLWTRRGATSGSAVYRMFNIPFTGVAAGSDKFWIEFDNDRIEFGCETVRDDGLGIRTTDTFTNTAVWYHIVGTCDTSIDTDNLKIYVNGVLNTTASSDFITEIIDNDARDIITISGRINLSDRHYNGLIEEFKFYDRALDATEVCNLCNDHGSCSC